MFDFYYLPDVTRVGVAGDWHGDRIWALRAVRHFHENGIEMILHLGDFGFFGTDGSGGQYLTQLDAALGENKQTLVVTPGNHEDYVFLSTFVDVPGLPGFSYLPQFQNIIVAGRGARLALDNTSFVFLGGANSIDRQWRVEGVSWWREESITLGDVYNTVAGGHAKIMICHDVPYGVPIFGSHRDSNGGWSAAAVAYANQSRETLRGAVDGVKPNLLMHGHYHLWKDLTTTMNDGLEDYTVRTVCLDKENTPQNLAILVPHTQEIQTIGFPPSGW